MDIEKYQDLPVEEARQQLVQAKDFLHSFWLNELPLGLFAIIMLALVLFFVLSVIESRQYIDEKDNRDKGSKSLFSFLVCVLSLACIGVLGLTSFYYSDKVALLETVVKEYDYNVDIIPQFKGEVSSIEVLDITVNFPVNNKYCPEIKESEKCHFIEFVSHSKITQSFIPVNKESFSEVEKALSLQYYDVSKDTFKGYIDYHDLEESAFGKYPIYTDQLIVGKSFSK